MDRCIVISDSFKGSLSSLQIAYLCEQIIPDYFPLCEVIPIPMADGGEGTVDCVLAALEAEPVTVEVSDPYMSRISATYAVYDNTAVIEMASAAGLPLVAARKNPSLTTTFGVGELIRHAVESGCKKIYLGLGGSATNDGGCGCAAALGTQFYNTSGASFIPVGGTLKNIASIDASYTKQFLEGVELIVMSDVINPLTGANGAAAVFGPQKGADAEMVKALDAGLENFGKIIYKDLGLDIATTPGAGAAGGMGAGAMALLGGRICSGIDALLELVDFDSLLAGTDLVITGEGRLDDQSFEGKVISGIAKRTLPLEIPVYAIVGSVGELTVDPAEYGISAVFKTNRDDKPFEEIASSAEVDYIRTLEDAMRYRRIQERRRF